MKKILLCSAFIFALQAVFAATINIVPAELRSYKIGEEVTFKAAALSRKKKLLTDGTYDIIIKDSAGKIIGNKFKVDIAKNNPFIFKAKLDRPGFILAAPSYLTLPNGKKEKWANSRAFPAYGGAAVEPEKIFQAGKEPADFDKFWQERLKEYEKSVVTVTPAPQIIREGYKVSLVRVTFPDKKGFIEGYLSIPEKPGKYPALAGVPGAGPGAAMANPAPYIRGSVPAIELWMNVHLFPVQKTVAEQRKKYASYNKTFAAGVYYRESDGIKENYIYAKVWPAVSKAIDYVAKLPEFDGKHFAAAGNSQGGGTALALAYLNKNITCVASSVPALCDLQGDLLSRQAGWPQLNKVFKDGKRKEIIAYFDCASFAKRIKVPAIVSVGHVDLTCYPTSVLAAYNNLKGEKKLLPMYRSGHRITAETKKEISNFLDKHLTK
ncbi:MAG: acetylxylan esterase [Lentisphaeria bacterium]|nr:acetylxylan esterase [Lentisphaeria bacterium]